MRRAAVIGMGSAGHRHYQAWQDAGWSVAGYDKHHDWRKAVMDADAVSICTPDDLHCEMVCFALAHGRHVLCEKPLTHRMSELEWIEAAVRRSDEQTFGVNFPLRHLPEVKHFGAHPVPAAIIDAAYEHGRFESFSAGWRAQIDGYSLLCGGGIHLVDLAIKTDKGTAKALGAAVSIRTRDGLPIYECGHFVFTDVGGSAGLVRITCMFCFDGPHRVRLTAWGPKGPQTLLDQTDEPYDRLADIRQFIADVENGNPGNGADAIRANRLCIEMSRGA